MKNKGGIRRGGPPPNFWQYDNKKVLPEFKEHIYQQYYSHDKLSIYCDAGMRRDNKTMAIACTYVTSASIIVKSQRIYPPPDCLDKNIFGELKAVLFAMSHYEKYLQGCQMVIIYTDVEIIEALLLGEIHFKGNRTLKKIQTELILLYKRKKLIHPHLECTIQFLPKESKAYNPFHRSSHNACNKILFDS
ncbi:hypothetical protein [Neobacillus drentensis]|uniref:hypothetical protein n=1 Tax=Neobacillus drentensis TaxID=220684 RepID=UPI002FFE4922